MKVGGNVHISRDRNVMQEAEQFSEFPAKIRKKKKKNYEFLFITVSKKKLAQNKTLEAIEINAIQ